MDVNDRITMTYGEFYDFPRQIRFLFGADWFFLRSFFDEEKDEYPDFYDVFVLPFRSAEEIEAHPDYWMDVRNAAHLGRIAISEVGLDETRRQSIDATAFGKWLSSRERNESRQQ